MSFLFILQKKNDRFEIMTSTHKISDRLNIRTIYWNTLLITLNTLKVFT